MSAFRLLALVATCLTAFALAGREDAQTNDVIVATAPTGITTASIGISIYTSAGDLKRTIKTNFKVNTNGREDDTTTLGISGDAIYAFLGSSTSGGKLAVVRLAQTGNPPIDNKPYTATFDTKSNLRLDVPNAIASGDTGLVDSFVFASEGVRGPCKAGQSIATRIVELRFTPPDSYRAPTISRGKTFEAFRSKTCKPGGSAILGMRTIGNRLYAVIKETPETYVLRSFTAFSAKPKRSKAIVTYTEGGELSAVTIDSQTSFFALAFPSDPVLIRVAKGKKPQEGSGSSEAKGGFDLLNFGGITSFTDGSGVLAAAENPISEPKATPCSKQRLFRFSAKTLKYQSLVLCPGINKTLQGVQIVPKPRKLRV